MLSELRVKNLGIIEDITWQLQGGLNVITGETGAGKSLIIDAVEILLSGKVNEVTIRYGADEAQIEGTFHLPQNGLLKDTFSQKSLLDDDGTLIINCRLRRKSSVTIRVNGQTITKSQLIHLGRRIVDIHGQSEHLSLLNEKSHVDILDLYAHTLNLRDEFSLKLAELRKTEQELELLEKSDKERARDEDYLRFQLDEITRSGLREGEEEELQVERNLLSSAEQLKEFADIIYRSLYEDDSQSTAPVLDKLSEAVQAMKRLVEMDSKLLNQFKYLEETVSGITEVARDIHAYGNRLQYDPERLEEIESRLENIKNIRRKYGPTVADVLAHQKKIQIDLDNLTSYTDRQLELKGTIAYLKEETGNLAWRLSQERAHAAERLTVAVKDELDDLNMDQVEFSVDRRRFPDPDGLPFPDGECYASNDTGVDIIEFMASTNPGEPVKPLVKIASTGELSRFTLAIKAALSGTDNIPVLIFDEIDIGVGGRSGDVIGKKLWVLGRNHQVICVTHLPQITAFADAHFGVRKRISEERTLSTLANLKGKDRIKEIAGMLAGPNYTETALNNARELVGRADKWKAAQK